MKGRLSFLQEEHRQGYQLISILQDASPSLVSRSFSFSFTTPLLRSFLFIHVHIFCSFITALSFIHNPYFIYFFFLQSLYYYENKQAEAEQQRVISKKQTQRPQIERLDKPM